MIKTWQQRCEEHPDHEGIVSEQMIRDRMQEEIDELRQALDLQTAIEKGTKAWADVPNATKWVEELRGNDTPREKNA